MFKVTQATKIVLVNQNHWDFERWAAKQSVLQDPWVGVPTRLLTDRQRAIREEIAMCLWENSPAYDAWLDPRELTEQERREAYHLAQDEQLEPDAVEAYNRWCAEQEPNPCEACKYATGEWRLPCTVNPLGFGTLCRDYTV